LLTRAGISSKVDDSQQTVGKRYARTDECGIPFAITVDNRTMSDNSVTIRELHTTKQIRLTTDQMLELMKDMTAEFTTWEAAVEKYGLYVPSEDTTE
jgi:glycyl-tRNA synthetase